MIDNLKYTVEVPGACPPSGLIYGLSTVQRNLRKVACKTFKILVP